MRKTVTLLLSVILTLSIAGCSSEAPNPAISNDLGYTQISTDEAVTMMAEEDGYVILDVRTPEEFQEKHIAGAINIPNEEIGTEPIDQLADLDQLILVYCRSGNRSKQASEKLAALGYTNVYEFGGINDWTGETE